MGSDYWTNWHTARTSRRRALQAALAAGGGAAGLALVGCGDDDKGSGGVALATPTPGANASPTAVDPFAGAKKGGTFNIDQTGDPPTLDPYGNTGFLTKTFAAYSYSRLYKYKTGPGIAAGDVKPVPDLAEKAEVSPDGLKWTVTLKQGLKFQDVAPVNGKAVTTEDVKYSWSRATEAKNTNRAQFDFVNKVEYPDPRTIVFTLNAPNGPFLDVLADTNLLWIMPSEADGKFDPAKTAIGSGPWTFESYTPSSSLKFKKNPTWYETGFPLMDRVEVAILPEYATRLAQFQSGATDVTGVNGGDLADVKSKIKDATLVGVLAQQTSFLYFEPNPASPWKDERVRQAISMSIDRDALNELAFEVSKLRKAGLDIKSLWNNIIPAGFSRFWLDPQSKEAGESGKYFRYDVAEAKKLLSAAGFANGFPVKWQYAGNQYGKDFNDMAEATGNYLAALGLKVTTEVQDYNSVYITKTSVGGNFTGIAWGPETPFTEVGQYAIRSFTDNPKNRGQVKDAALDKLAREQQAETDPNKRKQMFIDIQKLNAEKMYYVPNQYRAATNWTAYQPWIKNGDTFQTSGYGAPTETYPYRWKNK